MARITLLIFFGISIVATLAFPRPAEDIITQPKPGEEYVFVQTSGLGARPIARKDKHSNEERPFETAHKLPPSLTYALNHDEPEEKIPAKTKHHKREANPADAPAPAPAGAIKLDVQKLLEKYKTELKTSTPATRTTTKASKRGGNRRTKKEAKEEFVEVTSASPVLTTGAAAPKTIDDDIPLVASGSEKQRSRIQIKKAPNGQEYEYEYVYYYYDDDEDDKKVTNAHDGPARGQTSKSSSKTRGSVERTSAAPEANEVVPSSRGKTRGRQLGEEEVGEERLPANTRFPPRSRNLNTTPLPEEEAKATRGRGRGRPTTEAAPSAATEADNVSDETQGSRGRTRANVRRPSLELVDNASFNTHPGSEPSGSSPSFPTDLPAGPVRFLGATPNESVDPPEPISDKVPEPKKEESATETSEETGTTVMSAMDKVALDLYAILQGTQKLSGEDGDLSSEENSTEVELTTLEATTEQIVETTTPTTTTTTTTTTTPSPTTTTTTTTEASSIGRGRFKGRGRKTTHAAAAASTTEASHSETKPKSKFSRPSFGGRHRPGARTTPEPATEQEVSKEEAKPASHSRPTLSRSRFGATRSRTRTTAAPSESNEENGGSSTSAPVARPSLTRPRSSFNLRTRGRSTTPATENEGSQNEDTASSETSSTTARTRRIQAGSAVRPLRPGPRINLARGRPGQSTTTTTEEPTEDHVTGDEEQPKGENPESSEEKEPEASPAPTDNSPLGRLRNKHRINVQAKPKAAASSPVQVRRVNPLIARRRPGQTTEAASSEAPQENVSTEAGTEVEESEETEAPQAAASSTTEEPRGLNKLLAGRRRLAQRPAAHH